MNKDLYEALVRRLTDEGRLIEAGFVALRQMVIPPDAPVTQVNEMRKAFFFGAQHLWGSVMSILEPGAEVTANDLRWMTQINEELEEWEKGRRLE
jgi:hypothetical protein